MVNNYTIRTTYYDRKMDEKLLTQINERFPWIISYVKSHNCLDFQTGNDPKTNRSWFSIYRGTGRILTFRSHSGKVNELCDVAEAYKELMQPDFFRNPTPDQFDTYLTKIASTEKFKRYYEDTKGVRNEGFYQTLIGRRYTFEVKDTDDFILFDKELVIGFKTKDIKDEWNKEIVDQQTLKIEQLRKTYNGTLPEEIKPEYGEFDFLGLNTNGDILIMELKQNDPAKTALSPIQTSYYYLRSEQDTVRYNAGTLTTFFQHTKEQRQEQKLCLFGIGDCLQIIVNALGVNCSFEGRIGQAHGKLFSDLILLGNAVLVVDFRVADRMEHEVHSGNTKHGEVGIETSKCRTSKMLPLLRSHLVLVVAADIFRSRDQESSGTTGRIADGIIGGRLQQFDHHFSDMLRSTELAILACACQLTQHILIQVTLHIQLRDIMFVKIIQTGDDFLEKLGRGDEEHRITHVPGKGGGVFVSFAGFVLNLDQFALFIKIGQAAIFHALNGWKYTLGHYIENPAGIIIFELAPPHRLACFRLRENLGHLFASHVFKFFVFQFLLIE